MHEKLVPSLAAIEEKLAATSAAQETELRKALADNIKRVMG
jgi:hypothetical protein